MLPESFLNKTDECLREEMRGFPPGSVEAFVRFRDEPSVSTLRAALPGMIRHHLPRHAPGLAVELRDDHRLREDLGLDSLSLTEMAFKVEEITGVPIEIREVSGIKTCGELVEFLQTKMDLSS